jgi:hypothetical protein
MQVPTLEEQKVELENGIKFTINSNQFKNLLMKQNRMTFPLTLFTKYLSVTNSSSTIGNNTRTPIIPLLLEIILPFQLMQFKPKTKYREGGKKQSGIVDVMVTYL